MKTAITRRASLHFKPFDNQTKAIDEIYLSRSSTGGELATQWGVGGWGLLNQYFYGNLFGNLIFYSFRSEIIFIVSFLFSNNLPHHMYMCRITLHARCY